MMWFGIKKAQTANQKYNDKRWQLTKIVIHYILLFWVVASVSVGTLCAGNIIITASSAMRRHNQYYLNGALCYWDQTT